MRERSESDGPLAAAAGVLLLAFGWLCVAVSVRTGGHLGYALDDPYIHMAMARNLAQHGVWGVTPHGFTSSSSSPLWTGTLGLLYALTGVHEGTPLLLNLLLSLGVLAVAHRLLQSAGVAPGPAAVTLVALAAAAPLPALLFVGMEHPMHLLLTLLFAAAAARAAGEAETPDRRTVQRLALLAALLVLSRYEGLFLVAAAAGLLVLRGRIVSAAWTAAAGLLPVVAYGVLSLSQGWFFLPNSVYLKGKIPDPTTAGGVAEALGYYGYSQLVRAPAVLLPLVAGLAVHAARAARGTVWEWRQLLVVQFAAAALLHAQLAKMGTFYRYEAYLVGLGAVALAAAAAGLARELETGAGFRRPALGGAWALAVLLLAVAAERGWRSLVRVPQAVQNVHEQQYQMGLFLREYYPGSTVAANDIGAINYLADLRCVDLWGLGTIDTARHIRGGKYFLDEITAVTRAHGVRIALVYERPFRSGSLSAIPKDWIKCGEWRIRNNVANADDTVSFFAAAAGEAPALAERLRAFAPRLPAGVEHAEAAPATSPQPRVHPPLTGR